MLLEAQQQPVCWKACFADDVKITNDLSQHRFHDFRAYPRHVLGPNRYPMSDSDYLQRRMKQDHSQETDCMLFSTSRHLRWQTSIFDIDKTFAKTTFTCPCSTIPILFRVRYAVQHRVTVPPRRMRAGPHPYNLPLNSRTGPCNSEFIAIPFIWCESTTNIYAAHGAATGTPDRGLKRGVALL